MVPCPCSSSNNKTNNNNIKIVLKSTIKDKYRNINYKNTNNVQFCVQGAVCVDVPMFICVCSMDQTDRQQALESKISRSFVTTMS